MPDPKDCPLCFCGWDLFQQTLDNLKPSVIYDLGANSGGWVETFLKTGATVHAFEPLPDMAQTIRDRFGANPKVILNQLAVSDNDAELRDMNVFEAWCLLPANAQRGRAVEYADKPSLNIQTTTLDAYLAQTGAVPQFVKVDVDGYEVKALRGGANLFARHRPPMLFEYSYLPRLVGDSVEEMVALIYHYGYEAWSMNGKYRCPDVASMLRNYPEHSSYDIMLLPKT